MNSTQSNSSYYDVGAILTPLSGFNDSVLNDPCSLDSGNKTLHRVYTSLGDTFMYEDYDSAMRNIWPVLTVYFPAHQENTLTGFTNYADSRLQCLRATSVNPASSSVPPLPAGTPYRYVTTNHVSKGTIAGAVVGSVVGVALIAGAIAFFFLRKKTKRNNEAQATPESDVRELEGNAVSELTPEYRKVELGGNTVEELPGHEAAAEIDSTKQKPVELP